MAEKPKTGWRLAAFIVWMYLFLRYIYDPWVEQMSNFSYALLLLSLSAALWLLVGLRQMTKYADSNSGHRLYLNQLVLRASKDRPVMAMNFVIVGSVFWPVMDTAILAYWITGEERGWWCVKECEYITRLETDGFYQIRFSGNNSGDVNKAVMHRLGRDFKVLAIYGSEFSYIQIPSWMRQQILLEGQLTNIGAKLKRVIALPSELCLTFT